jgi:serine protease Do
MEGNMVFRKKPLVVAAIFTIVGLIIGLGISSNFSFNSDGYAKETTISKEAVDTLSKTNQAMVELVAAVRPSVVNISSTHTIKGKGMHSPFFNDSFFKRFFGNEFRFFEMPREYKQSGLGSGVIVDKDGYILTNNHVIKDADEIKVKLSDEREFKGKVVGVDPKTDLAVIKIDSNHLPVIKLGDSDKLQVGETVIAIGNPFGLSHTVTSGIVSATGRANVGIADYEDFIQTDAAINPGNSGGALVNIKGELVGINTAIFSTSGGYQGIGFAIPSNMAKVVMESLIKKGKVIRGWLGVTIQPLTLDIVKQFNLKDEKGALVADVAEDSPAEKAGIERRDVIVEFEGKKVEDVTNLRNMVANTLPNKEVAIKLIHNGDPKTVKVKIAEMSAEIQTLSKTFDNQLKGVHVQNLTPDIGKGLNVPKRFRGVVITNIEDGNPAQGILMIDDIIMEINKKEIHNIKDYESVASLVKSNENILLLIYRQNSAFYVTLSAE